MPNAALVNFAAGETSPRSRGRFDLDWFRASVEKCLNYIPEVPGSARYRSGFKFRRTTRGGAVARLVPFQLNDSQAYMLEFTAAFMRIYKDGDLLTVARTTVTAATKANPCVITVAATTNLANGDEVIITGVEGMPELNNRQFKLAGNSGSTYQLVDPVTGSNINSTNFGTYTSGGTLREVYEIASPYAAAGDLDNLQWAAINTAVYFTSGRHVPYKLTVDSAELFTLAAVSLTSSPFAVSAATLTLTGINLSALNTAISFAAGSVVNTSAIYTFAGVTGTTQIHGTWRLGAGTPNGSGGVDAELLKASDGTSVDSSGWTPYVSGGTATAAAECPIGVTFYESRLWYIGTNQRPNSMFASRAPNDAATRYDDFTGGVDADHAVFFTLAPANGQNDFAAWGRASSRYLFVGTFGGPFRVSGGGLDEPITPSNVNVRQFDSAGCEAVMPAGGSRLFYLQRGGTALRTSKYNADVDDLETKDMLLNAEHIAHSRLQRVVLQTGRPDVLWVVREDGILAGMSVENSENVAGWHRHKIGGGSVKVLDVQPLPRTDKDDQLWIVSERVVNSVTQRFVEFMADDVTFPDLEDFYTDASSESDDLETWKNAVYRRQEEYIHLDAAGTYDGSDRGAAASATLTPGAVTGTGVTFTASASVFKSTDVGKQLWFKPDRDTGVGSGRATITGYTSGTVVTATVVVDFPSTSAIAAGEWYFADTVIYGLAYLDGATVAVVTDGAVYSDGRGDVGSVVTVSGGKITLTDAAAVVHVGLPYEGFLKSHNLELSIGGGPAQAKPRIIAEAYIRFLSTLGVDFGTNIYDLDEIEWRDLGADTLDRPAPVFSGIRQVLSRDAWEREEGKHVIISQRLPLPCVVQFIDIRFDTTEVG